MTESAKKITSTANPEIKRIRSLSLRKYREEEGVFITEGLRHALEAAEAGWDFEIVVIEESVRGKDLVQKLLQMAKGAKILEVSAKVMETLAKRDNAQTILAVLKQRWVEISKLEATDQSLYIALEEIRDPGNLGTIMRTADATGAAGIILIGNTCDPYSLEAIRASMGSFPHLSLTRASLKEFTDWAARNKCSVIGTHLKTSHDYRAVSYQKPLVLVMGTEQAGLSDNLSNACTALVKIPMTGKADSLNVAVATSVMLYEIQRGTLKNVD